MLKQKQMFQNQHQNKIQIAQNQYDFSVLNEAFKIKRIGIASLSEQKKPYPQKHQFGKQQQQQQQKKLEMRKCKSKEPREIRSNQKQRQSRILKLEQIKQEYDKQSDDESKEENNFMFKKDKLKPAALYTNHQVLKEVSTGDENLLKPVEDEKSAKCQEIGQNATKMIIKKKPKLFSQPSIKKQQIKSTVELFHPDDINNKKIE
eukprot:TRINITY_DN6337_c0_g1_i4.p1 TRINITY_DN6337_c0_g1~~TRINITY_DN6337_c0_g1_i4.p1  ORF type:complete len:204 (+),score=36.89 TRINITY_DN6337_c0_g1_i4:247-858(+)